MSLPGCRRFIVPGLSGAWCLVSAAALLAQPSPQHPKRGWAGTVASPITGNEMNPNWYYTWGRTPKPGASGEFVPMAWSGSAITNPANFAQLTSHESEYILGFNEPERADQANMTVDQALALWPQLMATGKKLVSPGVGSDVHGKAWIAEFMTRASQLNYRVDAIAMHWYGDVRPTNAYSGFLSQVDSFHNTYTLNGQKLPVWVTEFAGIDWTNGVDPVTLEDNRRFLAGALPGLDSRAHVDRYAWFHWRDEASLGVGTPFTPTPGGDLYNGRTYTAGQTYAMTGDEGSDTFYMQAGTIQNLSGTAKTVRAIDFFGPTGSSIQGSVDVNIGQWMRIRPGVTVGKRGTNNLNFVGSTLFNDGTLSGKTGFMVFSDGAVVEGSGAIRTEWNADAGAEGIIFTESFPGAGGVTVNNRIWLNGGQFNILAGTHAINGEVQMSSNSWVNVAGNLTVNGQITAGGSLSKSGAGTLRLNAGSANTGAFLVSAGTLLVGNDTGSAHGAGTLTIGVNGTLTGDGTLGGSGVTVNGTLSPSQTASRPRPMSFTSPLSLTSTSRAIMDVGIVQADEINSGSTISLAGTLEMRPSILPTELAPMTLLSATSITGRFQTILGLAPASSPDRALAVTYTPSAVLATLTLLGDANVDGAVDFADLLSLAQNYSLSSRSWEHGDFTGEGEADFADLLLLAQNYGGAIVQGQPAALLDAHAFAAHWMLAQQLAAVPEPASLGLLAVLLGTLSRRRT